MTIGHLHMHAEELYDISVIKEILPHRHPFLFVDRVVKLKTNEEIVAEKYLSPGCTFFNGHFPKNPIMPGVLISEALAQTSGLLLGLSSRENGKGETQLKFEPLLLADIKIKFVHRAGPGDMLRLEARLIKEYGKLFLFKVAACVDDRSIAEGTLTLAKLSPG
jgi:3-hydroxyacyl-[acyl-carrier-protein] dehydratase